MAVVQQRSIVAVEGFDYADAFEVPMSEADARSAQELVRAGLKRVPRWLGMVVLVAHRHVLRLELAPGSSPNHVLGWEILTAEHDNITAARNRPAPAGVARGETSSAVECRARDVRQLPATGVGPHHLEGGCAHTSRGRAISTPAGGYGFRRAVK